MPRYAHTRDCPESNLYPSVFTYDGMALPTAEHHLMRAKAKLFNDTRSMRKIAFAVSGSCARKVGRKIQNFDKAVWAASCDDILEDILLAKFMSSPSLLYHITTTEGPFYEASTRSKTWGIGIHVNAAERGEPHVGQNKVGKALDRVQQRVVGLSDKLKAMAGPEGWERVQELVDDACEALEAAGVPDADAQRLPPEVAAEVVGLVCGKGSVTN